MDEIHVAPRNETMVDTKCVGMLVQGNHQKPGFLRISSVHRMLHVKGRYVFATASYSDVSAGSSLGECFGCLIAFKAQLPLS